MNSWHEQILATHEEAQSVALPPENWPGDHFPGVALPCRKALGKWIILKTPTGMWTVALVADVGPWAVDDESYVIHNLRPRAESYIGKPCPMRQDGTGVASVAGQKVFQCNGAGIDLFPATAKALYIPLGFNTVVSWKFICLQDLA